MTPGERPPLSGEGADRQARSWSSVLLVLSALGAWLVLGGVGLGVGTWRRLGPGAFPALIGALLIFATAALAWSRPAPASADEAAAASGRAGVCLRGVWAALAGLAGFALLAPALGYAPAAFAAALLGGVALRKNPLKLLLGDSLKMADAAWRTLTIRYGLYFVFIALANEVVWRTQSDEVWVGFRIAVLPLAIVFSLAQVPFMMKNLQTPDKEGAVPEPPDPGV